MRQLDQELHKLASYVGKRSRIEPADVDRLVGNSRAEIIWKIFDAIAAGNVKDALTILHRLFDQGEEPMRILGAFGMQLRRLAQADRLMGQGLPAATALEQAGVSPFGIKSAEQQLRHLGRQRLDRLIRFFLRLDDDHAAFTVPGQGDRAHPEVLE